MEYKKLRTSIRFICYLLSSTEVDLSTEHIAGHEK